MDALIRNDTGTYRLLDYDASLHPIGAQLCGSKPAIAGQSARILEDLGFDVIDLNCGCPVDKVTKDGSGSGLLKNPLLIGEIVSNIVAAVKVPVTVKIRAGWDEKNIFVKEIVEVVEKAGASAICVHGRTRAQGYKGPANWDFIRMAKQASKNIPVIGNGDIFSAQAALQMFEYTGCDAVLVARGSFGQPWIFQDIQNAQMGLPAIERKGVDYKQALLDHFELILEYSQERRALFDMRRVACWYLKNGKNVRALRDAINASKQVEDMFRHVEQYDWTDVQFSFEPSKETCEASC